MSAIQYNVSTDTPGRLSLKDLSQCIRIVKAGDAVDPDSAATEIPRAQILATAMMGKIIVGVGAIKRPRPGYSLEISEKSGVPFDPNTPELGYVAVGPTHQGNHLSGRIVHELLSRYEGALFATTSSDRMKKTLGRVGFVQEGHEWEGRKKQQISFWIKVGATPFQGQQEQCLE